MTVSAGPADDRITIVDEAPDGPVSGEPWRVLVADDDEQVHAATVFALSNAVILGRRLELLHAYSAEETRRLLAATPDVAVLVLDVVMESADSGLQLVREIREVLGLTELRIVLRTGQPGYAPELEAIRDYDINDYRTKSELTRTRLFTSLVAAIRSYEQIKAIGNSRRGLEKIVRATADLFERRGLESFAEGVLTQIADLLGIEPAGLVCAQRGHPGDAGEPGRLYVVGAAGRYAPAVSRELASLGEPAITRAVRACMKARHNLHAPDHTALYLSSGGREVVAYLDSACKLDHVDLQLLEVFCSNLAVGFSNVNLFQHLNFVAYHDPLTGLPNRRSLVDIINELQARGGTPFRVALVDVDNFAEVNDALGSALGDQVLRAVANRLVSSLPEGVRVCRYGGDVLAVLGKPEQVSARAVLDLFAEPFEVGGYSLPLSGTAGEVQVDGAPQSGLDVLQNASLALSRAKRGVRGTAVAYTAQMAEESLQRIELLQALRRAIRAGHLELHYQPQIELSTGRVAGVEALLRWRREDGRMVSPGVFVPLAERSGLIVELGEWVLFEACRQIREWRDAALGELTVAVNVSPPQFRLGGFTPLLGRAIDHTGAAPNRLELEITESLVMEDVDSTVRALHGVRELGVGVAIDDFGTGFSSLSYLQRLPIDAMKIDRAFVREADEPGHGDRIAEMIVALGRLLGLATVAEGVETESQATAARRWGCRTAQGFLYSPALPAPELARWVSARQPALHQAAC